METLIGKCIRFAKKHLAILGVPDMALPTFEVVTRTGARWAGQCQWKYIWPTCNIRVQSYMAGDERSLERVVAHEVIHHVLFMQYGKHAVRINHGGEFLVHMRVLNDVLGADFVTTSCGDDYTRTPSRTAITLLMHRKPGAIKPSISWYVRQTPRVIRIVQAMLVQGWEVRVANTDKVAWTSYPRTGSRYYATPTDDMMPEVAQLWERGQNLVRA